MIDIRRVDSGGDVIGVKFYYMNGKKKIWITMNRAAPEWCNLDCPDIYSFAPKEISAWNGWRINDGNVMETLPYWMAKRFVRFFLLSSIAYYRKYGEDCSCNNENQTNGFWRNFRDQAKKHNYDDLVIRAIGDVTPRQAWCAKKDTRNG